ncbi:TetR/AcrR family transcriptional regulator [Phytomonospora sp. NPDC050363]|uniref:TetR/AcrR family transcriptional regulator n=1 Tax=Phytomonospora sp. NPDC050363 TaxID=3155642 RepID=UPI0034080391
MGRPRQFSEERAVDAAMRVFWSQGYEATSTEALCTATGLGRSSIYNTFHSKHDLFARALEHYIQLTAESLTSVLDGEGTVRERLRRLLDVIVADAVDSGRDGCLGVNSMIELGPRDDAVDAMLRKDKEWRIALLADAVRSGQRDGELAAGMDPVSVAHFVLSVIGGIRVAARSGNDRAVLQGIADVAMAAL